MREDAIEAAGLLDADACYRILVIEDSPGDVRLLQEIVRDSPQIDLQFAGRLAEGLAAIERDGTDVVLLDLALPDSYGVETLDSVLAVAPHVPVVVLTGHDDDAFALEAVRRGAQDYVVKGRIDGPLLGRVVQHAIERLRMQMDLQRHMNDLTASEQRLHTIIERDADAIVVVNTDGVIRFLNPAAENLFGRSADAVVGQPFGYPVGTGEAQEIGILREGQRTVAELRSAATQWSGEAGYLLSLRDVSAHKHLEAELRQAIARLRELDEAKTLFVRNVSHELKTPLTSMTYAADNLLHGVRGPLPTRARRYLSMVKEDCRRLTRTVRDILDMTGIESDMLQLNTAKVPFGRLIGRVIRALHIQADAKDITLAGRADARCGFVECDPRKMERVISNVIQNAIKYTPSGGDVSVAARAEDDDGGRLVLEVTDTGIGIAAKDIPHVTERYYRVGEFVSGTGLGLSLCKEIVELHGGTLSIVSPVPGQDGGTRVSIHLPAASPPRVLVADDNVMVRKLLVRQLVLSGYQVSAEAGIQHLGDVLASDRPDLVLVDLSLSVRDDMRVVGQVRSNEDTREIPLIVMAGPEVDRTSREVLDRLKVSTLGKPWRVAQLLTLVENAVFGHDFTQGA